MHLQTDCRHQVENKSPLSNFTVTSSFSVCLLIWLLLLLPLHSAAPQDTVAKVYAEQPSHCSAAIEAALRLSTCSTAGSSSSSSSEQTLEQMLYAAATLPQLCIAVGAAAGAGPVTLVAAGKLVAAAAQALSSSTSAASKQRQQQLPPQQASLLVTLLKHTAAAGSEATTAEHVWQACQNALGLVQLHKAHPSNSSSSVSISRVECSVELLVLVARGLWVMQQLLAGYASNSSLLGQLAGSSAGASCEPLLQACSEAVAWLFANLAAAAAATSGRASKAIGRKPAAAAACGGAASTAVQGLIEQGATIATGLAAAANDISSSTSSLAHAAAVMAGDTGAQLQAFVAAACAQLPITKLCCNSSSCSSMARLSEAQIAGDRSTRCSACKAASYCSRECQLEHWKQHKKVCKQLAAQKK
jgi:hypothetical protein